MAERTVAVDPRWGQVDDYIVGKLVHDAPRAAIDANAAAGLPDIDVSAAQGKLLHLLARASGARRVLEVGTLGGYSTLWLARAVGQGGEVVTLEIDPHHARVAAANFAAAGMADRIRLIVGDAADSLAGLDGDYDLFFIDADKQNNAAYVREALRLARPGALVIVDNVVRDGAILDDHDDDPRVAGTRALFEMIATEPRLSASAIQTVGAKGWDGFLIAVVD